MCPPWDGVSELIVGVDIALQVAGAKTQELPCFWGGNNTRLQTIFQSITICPSQPLLEEIITCRGKFCRHRCNQYLSRFFIKHFDPLEFFRFLPTPLPYFLSEV